VRIAIFSTNFSFIGGAEICILNTAARFSAAGHRVSLYVPFRAATRLTDIMPASIAVNGIVPRSDFLLKRLGPVGRFVVSRQLLRAQRKHAFDLWHVHWAFASGYVATAFPASVPWVLTCHGADIQTAPELRYGMRLNPSWDRKIRNAIARAPALTAISRSIRTDMEQAGAVPERITDIPNGVDINAFARSVDRAAVRRKLNVPDTDLLILTTGRIHPKKAQCLIPRIVDRLRTQHEQFTWLVVGAGVVNELGPEVQQLGLNRWMRLRDQVPITDAPTETPDSELSFPSAELICLYKSADIYALPSLLEGMPLVLPEALAAGLCVVTTTAPGCRDVVTHNKTGLLAEPGNIESFAECLVRVLTDRNLRTELASAGKSHASAFSWDNVARQYESLFATLLPDNV